MSSPEGPRKRDIRRWLDLAIEAVDPEALVAESLRPDLATRTVIALGKAAPAMCRGAARVLGDITGVCATNNPGAIPHGIELVIGDHPVPGEASFHAGERALATAEEAGDGCLALISGGGSSICESPRRGVPPSFLTEVNRRLLTSGEPIETANLVRSHLSAVKCGGLLRAGKGPFHTLVLSDVAGAGPEVVASGPTLPAAHRPEEALAVLGRLGMEPPAPVWEAMRTAPETHHETSTVEVIGDGRTAAEAVVREAARAGHRARLSPRWLEGDIDDALARFVADAGSGVTVAAGETCVEPAGGGRGGRNTHAALLAAVAIQGAAATFAAFATDGVDGSSGAAGAIVDGATIERGGDPAASLSSFDSASYLQTTGDLVRTGPTGTNVADLWVLWQR